LLFGPVCHFGEAFTISDGEIGQHLAVDLDPAELEAVDELTVGEPVDAGGRVDSDVPKPPHVAFLLATVGVGVVEGMEKRLVRLPVKPVPPAAVSGGLRQHLLMPTMSGNASLYSQIGFAIFGRRYPAFF
jgi:hypothetical protein